MTTERRFVLVRGTEVAWGALRRFDEAYREQKILLDRWVIRECVDPDELERLREDSGILAGLRK